MRKIPDNPTAIQSIQPGTFDRGSGYVTWRPNGSKDFLLIYTRSGQGYCEIKSGERIALKPNTVILWDLHAYQSYGTDEAIGRWNILWAHFTPRPHWLAWLRWTKRFPGIQILELSAGHSKEVANALETTLRLARTNLPFARDLAMNAFERALIEIQSAASELPGSTMDPRIRRIVEWLATLPRDHSDGSALARRCGLSPSRFAHLFREETGTTPQHMLENNRMKVAAQLLEHTQLDIQEVAHEVGYQDALYFSRRFRQAHGRSPSHYRNKCNKIE